MPSNVETKSRAERTGRGVRPILVAFCEGTTVPFELPAAGAVTLGRDEGCELRIDHPSVSRKHTCIYPGSPVTVEDLGSRNGTVVRGVPVAARQRVPIHAGDVFECGDALVVLRELPLEGPTAQMAPSDALAASKRPVKELVVGPDGRWFEPAGGGRINLGRRGPLRRLLWSLTEQRLRAPGAGMPVERVIALGWPGEKIQHEAALARVYTTVQRLRALGLGEVLRTQDDGYLLDPAVPVRRDAG
jgi:pSer/pThr/pTyr-binding forkhead associated (FHA) protein